MLNTLYIDATNNCECTLIGNVDDKTARLQLNIICDLDHSPQLEIVGGRTVSMTSNPYLLEFTDAEIQGTGTLQFRIVDDSHTGQYFNVTKCDILDSTLYIKQADNFNYTLSRISSSGGGGGGTTVDAYTKAETNALLAGKSDSDHNHDGRYYTETEITNLLAGKSDAEHSHNDLYYTETEVNNLLAAKQNASTAITTSNIGSQSVKYATSAGSANAVAWDKVTGKPSTFTPAAHNHDDRYFTESEINANVPSIKTSGSNRSYRFPSGLQIETRIVSFTGINCTTLWGANFYESSALALGNWLQSFSEAPVVSVSVIYGSGYNGGVVECLTAATATSAGSAYVIVPNSTTGRNFRLQVTGVGRWK